MLLQSSLEEKWWEDSIECHCYVRNIQDLWSDEKTPCEKRFGIPINGPVIPVGAMVEYHPLSAKDPSRLHQFGPNVLPSIFLGYVLSAGRIWKRDKMVADVEELEEMDASELHARRLTVKISGGDQRVRTSTLIQDRPNRRSKQDYLRGETDGSSSTPRQDSSWYDGEAKRHDVRCDVGDMLKITGTLMEKEICQILGLVSQHSYYSMKSNLTDIHTLVRD